MSEKKEKFIIFALAGILLLIVCLPVKKKESVSGGDTVYTELGSGSAAQNGGTANTGKAAETGNGEQEAYAEEMERELEELLAYMEGVGAVKVMITLQSSREEIVEKDRPAVRSSVAENDGAGGSRNTNDLDSEEATVFVTDADGRQIPYVRKTMQPVVEGVAVLAEGGGSEAVQQNIREAIQALFGIDANKIKIAKMKTTK